MPTSKPQLRDRMRAMLAALAPAQRTEASARICQRVLELPEWRDARGVMCFLPLPEEVQTQDVLDAAWAGGKMVLAPRIDWATRTMAAVPIASLEATHPGRFGLIEPVGEPADVSGIDLVLVPGLAFDGRGNRLGRGGGFFDRFLQADGFRAATCGLAFDCQRVDELPLDAGDTPIGTLVTEAGVWRL